MKRLTAAVVASSGRAGVASAASGRGGCQLAQSVGRGQTASPTKSATTVP